MARRGETTEYKRDASRRCVPETRWATPLPRYRGAFPAERSAAGAAHRRPAPNLVDYAKYGGGSASRPGLRPARHQLSLVLPRALSSVSTSRRGASIVSRSPSSIARRIPRQRPETADGYDDCSLPRRALASRILVIPGLVGAAVIGDRVLRFYRPA
ncbi:hypothetical protein C9J85_02235 [Haloferax sp. wsp5]|nr:hypothetical protein C9J85_02235 [Haloferax sp. wsp5]